MSIGYIYMVILIQVSVGYTWWCMVQPARMRLAAYSENEY